MTKVESSNDATSESQTLEASASDGGSRDSTPAPAETAVSVQLRRAHVEADGRLAVSFDVLANLVQVADGMPTWDFVSKQQNATLGIDYRPKWALADEPTAFLQTQDDAPDAQPVLVAFADPLTLGPTPLSPLELYTFSLLGAAHRCQGSVRLSVMDAQQNVLNTYSLSFDDQMPGGTDPARYKDLWREFITPPNAAWLGIVVEKQPGSATAKYPDSFLFFADPCLVRGPLGRDRGAVARLDGEALSRLRDGDNAPGRWRTLRTEVGDLAGLAVNRSAEPLDISVGHFSLWENELSVCGHIHGDKPMPKIAYFIDGIRGGQLTADVSHDRFFARGEIAPKHLDGRRHMVDLRIGTDHTVVVGRSFLLAIPENGGAWAQRVTDATEALARSRAEADLLRETLKAVRLAENATHKLRERLSRLAPMLREVNADLELIGSRTTSEADQKPRASRAPTPPSPDEARLTRSSLFDGEWYARTYMSPADEMSPARHYLQVGFEAGSAPHPLFHARWYRSRFMKKSDTKSPFLHFLETGLKRKYQPHPLFDVDWFIERYQRQDLADAMRFFQRNSFELQLDPHPLFLTGWYLATYPAARDAAGNPLLHYMEQGAAQDYWPNPLFDPKYYKKTYGREVETALNALVHFVELGSDKGLNPNGYFSTSWYRTVNADVQNWIPLAHYLHVGGPAGRDPSATFDTASYRIKQPDLDTTRETALAHFLRHNRGRPPVEAAARREVPAATVTSRDSTSQTLVNWVIGPKDNLGWAYGNNATRLSAEMPEWRHAISGDEPADLVLYFDALVADRYPTEGRRSVLRVGGARPLDKLYGSDREALRKGLARFEAIITLSPSLQRRVSAAHPNVVFIPNGIDLTHWQPAQLRRAEGRPFTVGFAASATSTAERDVKGLDIAIEAARLAGLPLLRTHKGKDQIRHDRMIEDFYSKIDVLLHPVAPGREGSSNVIMEAIALGIPVITTLNSGFHGETFIDGEDSLICSRNPEEIAALLTALSTDPERVAAIGEAARRFALRNHDIKQVAAQYKRVLREALVYGEPQQRNVSFLPFWKPTNNFASSRLRGDFPSELLGAMPSPVGIVPDDAAGSDVAIVIQMADDPLYTQLAETPEKFVVYDVCDRYFENDKQFKTPSGTVNSLSRFGEMMQRANVVIAPSAELKAELAARFPDKPVYYVPEMIDYSRSLQEGVPATERRVVWFGSPQRGNFDSARWILDAMVTDLSYELTIISRKSYFQNLPEYAPHVVNWSADSFIETLRAASICVVSHADEEKTKSPNRFVTAVAHGVPTIVANSQPCAALLRAAGCGWAVVSTPEELAAAVTRLEQPGERLAYLQRVQAVIEQEHGNRAVRAAYLRLLTDRVYDPARKGRRVAFVTHNLNFGEGAPKSLFEVVCGLRDQAGIVPVVYCAATGDLAQAYAEKGITLSTFSSEPRPPMRVLNNNFDAVRRHFKAFLTEHGVEHVVANTIKSATFATFAEEMGIPATIIIRESFAKEKRFDYYLPEPHRTAEAGLLSARTLVFVSGNTEALWSDQPMTADVRLIKNGVNPKPFAGALALSKAEARAQTGLAETDIVAVCVGTINERKGQLELVEWYRNLPEPIRNRLTIVFVGATENRGLEQFRAVYDRLKPELQARLIVVPTTPDIGMYYRAADLFLMNSSQESYPRSTMEALLFGLPIVSTPVFGVLEQVVDGENGFIYPYGDSEAWQTVTSALISDEDLRTRMSAAAATSFWKLTTYAEMIHDYRCIVSR